MNIFKLFGSVALEGADKVGSQLSNIDGKSKASSSSIDEVTKSSKSAEKVLEDVAKASEKLADSVGAMASAIGEKGQEALSSVDEIAGGNKEVSDEFIATSDVIKEESLTISDALGTVADENEELSETVTKTTDVIEQKSKVSSNAFKNIAKASKLIAIGIGAAATALGVMVTKSAQATDRIDKMSQKIGMSRKAYQEWDYIMSQNGASVDGLQMSMKTLATQVEAADKGNETARQTFKELGIDIYDVNGQIKDQETLFNESFSALASYKNETKRTALASTLLGRSATELAPAFNSGAESIEVLRDRAHELGLVLGDDAVDAGVRLTDAIDTMKRSISSASINAISPLMPIIENLANKFTEKLAPAFRSASTWAYRAGLIINEVWTGTSKIVGILADSIAKAVEKPWEAVKKFLADSLGMAEGQGVLEFVIELTGDIYKALKAGDWGKFWELTAPLVKTGVTIATVLSTAGIVASSISSSIGAILTGASVGFVKMSVPGVIAGISLAISISEAISAPAAGWAKLASNVGVALAGAFAVGVVTGNPALGFMTFTMLLNFKVGEVVGDALKMKPYKGNDEELLQIQNIVTAAEGILSKYGAVSAAKNKLIDIWSIDTGRQMLAGLGIGLDGIDKLGESSARILLQSIRDELGIRSPSEEGEEIGEYTGEGIAIGIEKSLETIPEIFGNMITNVGRHLTAELPENITQPIVKAVEDAVVIARSSFDRIKDFGINLWDGVKDFGIGTWNFIKDTGLEIGSFFKDLFTNPLDLLDRQLGKFLDNLKFTASVITGVFKGIGTAIVGSSGVLSGAADAWKSSQIDPETGEKKATIDLAGGITGVLTSLITSSSQFGELMEAINPILQKVADFFGRLLTPLIPIVTLIADALMPLLNLLEPFLLQITWLLEKVVTPIIQFLSDLIITIYNTIAGVFNWVLGILDALPFVRIKYRLPTAENVNPATATQETQTQASGGGTQVSEITGATRDLLTSLLSPLSSLDSLTGIGNRIYDLLEERLVGGVTIGTINVTGTSDNEANARAIEEAISERLAFMGAV